MAVIQVKYSTVAGHVPSGLVSGQLAINLADGLFFWNNSSGVLQTFSFASPLVSTMGGSDSSNHAANTAFVQGLITALIGSAPATLNTLGELAAAINSDPKFYQTVNASFSVVPRFDAAQTLSGAQIQQLYANLGLSTDSTIDGAVRPIKHKRSSTAGAVPTGLLAGEFTINQADGILYWIDNNGVQQASSLYGAPIEAMASNNLLINGGQEVSQQNGVNPVVMPSAGGAWYITDQWIAAFGKTGATFSANQATTNGAPGFNNSLVLKVTNSGFTSPLVGSDYASMVQWIEGYRWARLGFSTASAMPVTIGFWCFPTISGIGVFSLRNAATNRTFLQEYTVVGGTWNWVSFVIPGDQTGTWPGPTNASGALLGWSFGNGSTTQGPNKQWSNGNYIGTQNVTNFFSTINNTVSITGLVCVPGALSITSSHAPYLISTYEKELNLCMRYWETGEQFLYYRNQSSQSTYAYDTYQFRTQKRAAPTMTYSGYQYYSNGTPIAFTPTSNNVGINRFELLGQNLTAWMGWLNTGVWTANARM